MWSNLLGRGAGAGAGGGGAGSNSASTSSSSSGSSSAGWFVLGDVEMSCGRDLHLLSTFAFFCHRLFAPTFSNRACSRVLQNGQQEAVFFCLHPFLDFFRAPPNFIVLTWWIMLALGLHPQDVANVKVHTSVPRRAPLPGFARIRLNS